MRIQHEGLTSVVELLHIKYRLGISPGKLYSLADAIFTLFVVKIIERKEIVLRVTGLLKKKLEFPFSWRFSFVVGLLIFRRVLILKKLLPPSLWKLFNIGDCSRCDTVSLENCSFISIETLGYDVLPSVTFHRETNSARRISF